MRIILFKFLIFIVINVKLIGQVPGTKKWEFLTGGWAESSPAIGSDGTVYIGSSNYKVYALNGATGAKKWEFLATGKIFSSPAIGIDGTVYVGSEFRMYALNGVTGAKKWEFMPGTSFDSSPAIGSDGTVYVGGSSDGKVYALNGATGAKKWAFLTGDIVESSPAIGSDGTVYVGDLNHKVYALNGATGAKKWEFLANGMVFSSPAIGFDGTVYVGTEHEGSGSLIGESRVYALNGATGAKRWEFRTGEVVNSSPAIGSDGTVYVATGQSDGFATEVSENGALYALNGATGTKKWEFRPGGRLKSSPAIGSDGTVYLGSTAYVYAIATLSKGLAKSPWPKFRANNLNTGKFSSSPQPLIRIYSSESGLNLDIPVSPNFDTILEYSTNLNQWSEQQRFSRQSGVPSIVVPLKIDQQKSTQYWRARSQ